MSLLQQLLQIYYFAVNAPDSPGQSEYYFHSVHFPPSGVEPQSGSEPIDYLNRGCSPELKIGALRRMDDRGRTIVNLALARHGEAGIVRFSAVFRNDHNCLGNLLVRRAEGSRDAAGGGADRHAGFVVIRRSRSEPCPSRNIQCRRPFRAGHCCKRRKPEACRICGILQQFQCCPEP